MILFLSFSLNFFVQDEILNETVGLKVNLHNINCRKAITGNKRSAICLCVGENWRHKNLKRRNSIKASRFNMPQCWGVKMNDPFLCAIRRDRFLPRLGLSVLFFFGRAIICGICMATKAVRTTVLISWLYGEQNLGSNKWEI